MPPSPFPKGIDDKLTLGEPETWDVDRFKGHDRMAVARGNTALRGVFEETETALPKLIASVRWSILRRPYADFARESGMSPNGYKPMEKDVPKGAPVHREKYTKLLAYWAKKGISIGVREQMLDLLTMPELLETDPPSPDLLSAIQHLRGESALLLSLQQMTAFYHRVGYDVGHAKVEGHFPALYNTIWQRERTGTVPDYKSLADFIATVYAGKSDAMTRLRALRMAHADGVWEGVRRQQYVSRTLETPLADLLLAMERDLALKHGVTLTSEALRDQYGFGSLHAQQLIQCELVEPGAIEKTTRSVIPVKQRPAFTDAWTKAYEAEQRRHSFGKMSKVAMDERGYTAADLGKILEVKPPEERGRSAPAERSQRYRPDAEVRNVLFYNHVSRQISVEALLQVIARDDAHADLLRQAYVTERTRFFRRSGARIEGEGLQMRIWRELANMEMRELALQFLPARKHGDRAAVREKDIELQRLERNEAKTHAIKFSQVMPIIRRVAEERAAAAVARAPQLDEIAPEKLEYSTVQGMAQQLIAGVKGGASAISDAMRNIAQNDTQWLRSDLITKMGEGKFVSALPPLRTMAKAITDGVLSDEVIADWYRQFPVHLTKGAMEFGKVTVPVARVVCTLIAAKEASPMRFFSERVPGGVPTHGTKHLRDLETGTPVDWRYVHKYLLAVGLQPGQIAYRLAKTLYDNGNDVSAAMRELVPRLKELDLAVDSVNLPGLMTEELKQWKKK